MFRRLGRDAVLVEAGEVLDELRVGQDPLGGTPKVVDHLAARGRVGYPIWKIIGNNQIKMWKFFLQVANTKTSLYRFPLQGLVNRAELSNLYFKIP